jgi:hypothetical protein
MLNDQLKVTGDVVVEITGPDGQIKDRREIKNLVVATGKTHIASRIVGTPTAMSHMAIGSSSTAASTADTTLGASLGRVALTSATSSGAVVTYVASFPAGTGTGAVVEAGVFNDASAGTMLCRTVFAVVNKGADDAMSITWAITVS